MPRTLRTLFLTPIASHQHCGLILLIALAFVAVPQFDYNDWERNTEGLFDGLHIYDNPNAVYPPWGLILLWPYYLLTSPGSRIASVLVVGWLAARRRWTVATFLSIVFSPFFIWTMVLSNIDVLALLLPVLLWESARGKRWQALGWSASLALLLIKPQGSFLLILYWLWSERKHWRALVVPLVVVALLTVPISLVGQPPLVAQWLDNLRHPSEDNQLFWEINNVSMTETLGVVLAVAVVAGSLGALAWLRRRAGGVWTQNHTHAALLLASMLLAPYTSNQSVIVPLALVPSGASVALQYVILFTGTALGIYREFDPWWTLLIGLCALWLYRPAEAKDRLASATDAITPPLRKPATPPARPPGRSSPH